MMRSFTRRAFLRYSGFLNTAHWVNPALLAGAGAALRRLQEQKTTSGDLMVVETSGSPFEIGREYARKVGERFTNHVRELVQGSQKRYSSALIERASQRMLGVLEHDFPYLVEEMHGMARGSGLSFSEVAIANLSAGFAGFVGNDAECTNVIFPKSDRGPLLGRTLDGSTAKVGAGVVRMVHPQTGYSLLCHSRLSGLSTVHGVNSKGLGVGEASLHFPTVNPRGIVRNLLPRLILQECANVEEAVQFLSRYPVLRLGFHFALVDCPGQTAIVERSPTEMHVRRGSDGPIFCTNHAATPSVRKLELSRGLIGDRNSDERFAFLQSTTSAPRFEQTLDRMKQLLRSHRKPVGICQHGELEMFTRRAYIVIAEERKLLITRGPACRNTFQEFSLPSTA